MPDSGWSHDLACGARQVDAANEGLFFLIANLFLPGVECKRRNGVCPRDGCGKVAAVLRYLTRNFAAQDKLMAEAGYPDTATHCTAHAELLARLRDLSDRSACGDWEDEKLSSLITAWAVEHVRAHDKLLGEWLGGVQPVNLPTVMAPAGLAAGAPPA